MLGLADKDSKEAIINIFKELKKTTCKNFKGNDENNESTNGDFQ